MADLMHLEILKRGVNEWNRWRMDNPDILPDLRSVKLIGADLTRCDFNVARLNHADFSMSNLSDSNLIGARLGEAVFTGACLRGALLSGADLHEARLVEADLDASDLVGADLFGADLMFARFTMTDLRNANLTKALLDGSGFTDALVGWTVFGDNDLSAVKGLEKVDHFGPSTIGIDTIYKSKGNIPECFLRGAGVPEDFITYMKSLAGKAIEFYSCFISYSTKDSDFAQRLHADFQQKGVRCWFAPEDLKIGDKFRMRIDESIRVYDKLMVILSANSIDSPWVEEEVEAAFEKEHRQNKPVLFPIRLDDAVMETEQAWAANLRRTRHIGDFRAWKDHDPYQKSFDRLLRDLRA